MATDRPKDDDESKKEADEPDERPTVIPKFDPAELAKKTADSGRASSRKTTPFGMAEVPAEARRGDSKAAPPPESAQPETTQMPESMRASLLSMADSRVPSVKPAQVPVPDGAQRRPSGRGIAVSALDKGWEELTLEEPISEEPTTKPSKSDGPFRRPTSRLRAPSGKHKAKDTKRGKNEEDEPAPSLEDEVPTREVPVLGDEKPPESRGVAREEPDEKAGPNRIDTPEHTVFAPARAAAALTAHSSRPPAGSDRPKATAESAAKPASTEDTIREMRDRFSLGDYTGALVLAEGLLEDVPNNPEVKECAENCRQVLRQMYTARIGPLDRVPVVTVARDQLRWLSIDHRAGFVLSHIDGVSSLEMILDVSGMPLLDALRILCELAQQRIISFR